MIKKVNKLVKNPLHYLILLQRKVKSIFLFPVYFFVFREIKFYCYISFRSSILNFKNISLGHHVFINPFVTLWPTVLNIGDNVQINPGTSVYGKVTIGNNVMIAPNCMIVGGDHSMTNNSVPMILQESTEKGIIIEDDVWIGANSVITDGVVIAKGSVIGAGSVVTKNTEPNSINIGVPAKFLKYR
jgi:acetyltransferase-like isoleucine patch superfamily enzyme